jgi:biopolymer transport protein TolQ
MESVHRNMRVALSKEQTLLEKNLPFLATVASVSPYIGLFGTVWGIMNSFRGLAGASQATLSAVAPGISEALIATAIGLFAAIPALIAYNKFITDSDNLISSFESFKEEFLAVLYRDIHTD